MMCHNALIHVLSFVKGYAHSQLYGTVHTKLLTVAYSWACEHCNTTILMLHCVCECCTLVYVNIALWHIVA